MTIDAPELQSLFEYFEILSMIDMRVDVNV